MAHVITELRDKIRALVGDFIKTDTEVVTCSTSNIFTLQESGVENIVQVSKNGTSLGSGDWSYDSSTNKVTITTSCNSGDIIEIIYTYYKYSQTEIDGYIKASLVWLSVFDAGEKDFEIEDSDIYPTPNNQEEDIIALVASIIIKPNWSEYRLPNVTLRYPRKFSKEEKIERLINKWTRGLGVTCILEWDYYDYNED